jgi:hypothetical protein
VTKFIPKIEKNMIEYIQQRLLTSKKATPIFKDTCAEIYHIEEGNVVYLIMKGLTKNQCYQANAERALSALVRFKSSKMLMDFRELIMMSLEDQRWTEEVWQPQAAKAGLQYIATLMPDNLFAALTINKVMDSVRCNASFDNESFVDESEAYEWLVK